MPAVVALALVLRLIHLDHTPQWDEFYHVLAARSWNAERSFAVGEGEYPRTAGFTRLVAAVTDDAEDPWIPARLPAAVAGSLLAALLFVWTRREAGRAAAWIAALLVSFSALSIHLSQLARFYTLHALCFLVAAVAVFHAFRAERSGRTCAGLVALAAAALLVGFSLQPTTAIGAVGLGLWGLGALALQGRLPRSRAPWLGLAAAGALGAAALLFLADGLLPRLQWAWDLYRTAPGWAAHRASRPGYYLTWMATDFAVLGPAFPLAAALAVWRRRAFGGFCLLLLVPVLIFHSVGAAKGARYVFYALPFFFAVWAVALAEAGAALSSWLSSRLARAGRPRVAALASGRAGVLALCCAAAILVGAQRDYRLGILMLARPDSEWDAGFRYRGFADWEAARSELAPLVRESDVLLSSAGVKSLFYLDRLDYEVSATIREETDTGEEFGRDPRTGSLVISDAASLARVMRRHPSGVAVMERRRWRKPYNVPDDFADYLEAHAARVPVPPEARLLVFRWPRGAPLDDHPDEEG